MAKSKRKGARPVRRSRARGRGQNTSPKTHTRAAPARSKAKAHRAPPALRKSARAASASTLRLPFYLVDAFTRRRLHGNPAAVVVLPGPGAWLPDDLLQALAIETSAPATAFVLERPTRAGTVGLRWFTHRGELSLCGHGTLAAAHTLWTHRGVRDRAVSFATASSGTIGVERIGEMYVLDMPSIPGAQVPLTGQLSAALGVAPTEVYHAGSKLLAVFDNRRHVYALTPSFAALAQLDADGVIVTAPGAGHDFVSRYFAPRLGLLEDHVTGSSHCTLIPYWSRRLGKKTLFAHQVSRRGGELMCEDRGERVRVGGHAITTAEGTLSI
ncbi:MAG: PhzF family phenazine biosynthesis protein [Phycisphaerales bacterium]